jgi:Phospholipid N-methyltransferase
MFIRQLLAKPGSTGAVLPSSDALAERIIGFANPPQDAVIAEFGPGTGVFTAKILASLLPDQHFFAIEINPDFAKALRKRFPRLSLYEGDAANVKRFAAENGFDRVDCIISGLPWANFPDSLQTKILDSMIEVMPPGGVFATFAYLQGLVLPAGRAFKENLKKRFSLVEKSEVIWKNIPPAIIYRCCK